MGPSRGVGSLLKTSNLQTIKKEKENDAIQRSIVQQCQNQGVLFKDSYIQDMDKKSDQWALVGVWDHY